MSKFHGIQESLQSKLAPIAGKIESQRHISAMKNGIMATLPLTILGGVALIVATPPVDPKMIKPTNFFNQFLLAWKDWATANSFVLTTPYNMTMGLLGLFTVIAVAYNLLKRYDMDVVGGITIAAVTFLCIAAPARAIDPKNPSALFLQTTYLDAKGMFFGIILAFLTVELTKFLMDKNIKIKLPADVPPMVSKPFEALIPFVVNVVLFSTLNNLLIGATGLNMPQVVLKAFAPLVSASDSLPALIVIIVILNILWFFGIHGGNVVGAVVTPFATMNLAENAAAIASGAEIPHNLAGSFINVFANIGGSGGAFGLVVAMLIVTRSSHLRSVAKLGFLPNIFGISEPLVFSTPLILNPFLLIPLILAPVTNIIITYIVFTFHFVGRIYVNIPWTTPGPIMAFLSTMDWKAVVLWFMLVVIDVIIYMPFLKAYDKTLISKEKEEVSAV